jgi:bifunctional DNase/RNase
MTHDLLRNVIRELGVTVERVEVTELRDNTFFAAIHLRTAAGVRVIDSRPSDAIALALRVSAPVFVEEGVIAQLGKEEAPDAPRAARQTRTGPVVISDLNPADRFDKTKWAEFLESLDPEDFGKYKM